MPTSILAQDDVIVQGDITAGEVKKALESGLEYLRRQQSDDGWWPEFSGYRGGVTALSTLAMLQCGVPADDPQIQKALRVLRNPNFPMEYTYVVSLRAMALCAAEPERDLAIIRRCASWLEAAQVKQGVGAGCWSYRQETNQQSGDNSNGQFALLGLWEASRVGIEVDRKTWERSLAYWKRTQDIRTGSWGYDPNHPGAGRGSMTCAGIASIVICSGRLAEADAQVLPGGRVDCCAQGDVDPHVERGLAWLGRPAIFAVTHNPNYRMWQYYYLYALERVGRLTANRYIGSVDWYRAGCAEIVRTQDEISGSWRSPEVVKNDSVSTSFALMFLAKGRRPVMMAKLDHAPRPDWNNHRGDVNNLTRYVEKQWKMELTWQNVDSKASNTDDLLQSPVLYISGSIAPQFSDQEVQNLREYIQQGGYIFAEASCPESDGFDRGFRDLIERMFPEGTYRLRPLPPDHAVWHAYKSVDQTAFELEGVNYACRTSIFYCPSNIGCYWELGSERDIDQLPIVVKNKVTTALDLGVNVMQYTTGRELKFKYEVPRQQHVVRVQDPVQRAKLYIAKLKHSGGWDVAPAALTNLLRALSSQGVRANTSSDDRRLLEPNSEEIFNYHMVFMHGRRSFEWNAEDRQQLRTFLERGGLLLADAICGNQDFADAFKDEVRQMFPDAKLERIPDDDPILTDAFGGFDIRQVTRRVPQTAGQVITRKVPPELYGLKIDGRYAVVFSPFDLSCALENQGALECRGYIHEDAVKIGINVVLYSFAY